MKMRQHRKARHTGMQHHVARTKAGHGETRWVRDRMIVHSVQGDPALRSRPVRTVFMDEIDNFYDAAMGQAFEESTAIPKYDPLMAARVCESGMQAVREIQAIINPWK